MSSKNIIGCALYYHDRPPSLMIAGHKLVIGQGPLTAGLHWEYQSHNLPLEMSFTCIAEVDMMFCQGEMHTFIVQVAQVYETSWMYWTDYYVDGFGIAEMIRDGHHMILECPTVSTQSTSWDSLKALYQ